jgi:hypothetical protein
MNIMKDLTDKKVVNLQHVKNRKHGDSFRNPDGKIRLWDLFQSDKKLMSELTKKEDSEPDDEKA